MSALVGTTDIDRVREATDLVALIAEHIPLRPKGREHVGLCPFHDDHTPSLAVVTHKGNAFYKCHACGVAGDVFNFVIEYHKMTFPEALKYLADRAGITLSRRTDTGRRDEGDDGETLRRANAVAAAFYRQMLTRDRRGASARAHVEKRRIGPDTAEQFMIGAAPDEWEGLAAHAADQGLSTRSLAAAGLIKPRSSSSGYYDTFRNRLIFPICDELGRPIAFGGRRIDPGDEPKYLNSPESALFHKSKTLYGLHLAKRAVIDASQVIVTEGYTDVVACHQAGLHNVVATLGTALTRDHVRMLKRLCQEVVLVFDGDEAGRRAADRAVELFFAESLDVRICILPEGDDPADLLGRPQGLERLREALDEAHHALDFKVGRFRRDIAGIESLGARHRVLERLMDDLAALGFSNLPGVRKAPVLDKIGEVLRIPTAEIEQAIPRRRGRPAAAAGLAAGDPSLGDAAAAADLWQESADVAPARRRAERELLAALIHQPSLRHQPITIDKGSTASVTGVLQPEQFADPASRRLAEIIWPRLERDESFTVQQLMGELDHPSLRELAGELYLDAEKGLAHGDLSPVEHLRERCAALLRILSREVYQRDLEAYRRTAPDAPNVPDADQALLKVLEQRRKQGYIPEALPTRVRT